MTRAWGGGATAAVVRVPRQVVWLVVSLVLGLVSSTALVEAAGAAGANPASVGGLVSRWRAADLALADGSAVSSWVDPVSGVVLTQPTSTRRPRFVASSAALANQPAVAFSRASLQSLVGAASAGQVPSGYLSGASGVTVVVVMVTAPSISTGMTTFFASTGTSTSAARVLSQVTAASQAGVAARRLDTDTLATVNGTASVVAKSTPYVSTGALDFAAARGTEYLNGASTVSASLGTAGSVSPTGSQRVVVGVNGSDANAFEGQVAEILVYSKALSATDRATVHQYVRDTYGIVSSDAPTPSPTTTTTSPTTSTTTTTTATSTTGSSSTVPATTTTVPTTTTTTTTVPVTTTTVPTTTTTVPTTTTSTTSTTTAVPVRPDKVSLPSTMAPTASLAAGSTVTVMVTAKQSSGAVWPGSTVYLKLQATDGGGTAWVGGARLGTAYAPFVTDAAGQVAVTYTTPSVLPKGGRDVLTVANASSGSTSSATSGYSFTTTARYAFSPEPLGAPGSLAPSQTVQVVATSLDSANRPVPGAQICTMLAAVSGGGRASVGAVALTTKYQCFTSDGNGNLAIAYTTPATLPSTGMDIINVRDTASSLYAASSYHAYSFGQLVDAKWSPSPIAPTGSLKAGATVQVTLTPVDATGAQVAGATVRLSLESSVGATASATGYAEAPSGAGLTSTPKTFLTHSKTKIVVSYKVPKTLPASGTDRLIVSVTSASGVTTTRAVTYSYAS